MNLICSRVYMFMNLFFGVYSISANIVTNVVDQQITQASTEKSDDKSCHACDLSKLLQMHFPACSNSNSLDNLDIFKNNILTKPKNRNPIKRRYSQPEVGTYRLDDLTPEEREERVNRGFARLMQLMTFFGHVDNYLTDKASGLIKIMGKAIEADDQEEDENVNYRYARHPPRIHTTIKT